MSSEKGKPRKPPVGKVENLCVSQLNSIPSKRRLEMLFESNFIPCRRQLALKYNLSEEIVHNVLSHRRYLLENWHYNADENTLLSKVELENAIAMQELLFEWKRRVQLSGLKITDTALSRKAVFLRRAFSGNNDNPSEKWWDNFEVNWNCKHFQDYESDSLEMEDILNDLQWMFSEKVFSRLKLCLRKAKSGGQQCFGHDLGDSASASAPASVFTSCSMQDEDSADDVAEEPFEIRNTASEPHCSNDDDFDCEEYEFIVDEEAVTDALRNELKHLQQAKYEQYLLRGTAIKDPLACSRGPTYQSVAKQETGKDHDNEKDGQLYDGYDDNGKGDSESDGDGHDGHDGSIGNGTENCDGRSNCDVVTESIDPVHIQKSSIISNSQHNKTIIQCVQESSKGLPNDAIASTPTLSPYTQPKRKKRNSAPMFSLRKDSVRMPTVAEAVQLARNQCLQELLRESDDEDKLQMPKRYNRKTHGSPKTKGTPRRIHKAKIKDNIPSVDVAPSPRFSSSHMTLGIKDIHNNNDQRFHYDDDNDNDDDDSYDVGTGSASSTLKPDSPHCDSFDEENVKLETPNTVILNVEKLKVETYDETSVDLHSKTDEQNNNNNNNKNIDDDDDSTKEVKSQLAVVAVIKDSNRNVRRSSRVAAKSVEKASSLPESDMDIENEISNSPTIQSVQSKEMHDDVRCQRGVVKTKKRTATSKSNTKKTPAMQENANSTALKHSKRRTDDSDLTLRKDKVRLNLVRATSENAENPTESIQHSANSSTETEVQMIYQPFLQDN